jgi:ribonucleoside-triphosphate reductase
MSLKALSDYTLYAKYSHYLPEKKRRETWPEIVERVFGMHERKFQKQLEESEEFRSDFEFAKRMVRKKRVLGSQRALQFAGPWIEKNNLKLYNCSSHYIDRPRAFSESIYLLLCGVGLGFSVQKEHVQQLPEIRSIGDSWRKFKIEDSIEGWADAIGAIVNSYFPEDKSQFPHLSGHKVIFDYSQIRPEGSLIAGQFKAPGPNGLEKAVELIRVLIEKRINSPEFTQGEFAGKLRPIDCYDIVMYSSDAVLSGGVRRSASLCLFSVEDQEMINAKTGSWFIDNPQRARSNNSAALIRGRVSEEQFSNLMKSTKEFGEPGFIWVDDNGKGYSDIVYNPCCEIGMVPQTEDGESGVQGCNLTEINGKFCTTEEEFLEACRASAIIGTMQAAYTSFPYVKEATKKIFDREALLGCSITGFMDNPEVLLNEEIQRKGADEIKKVNEKISKIIGINPSARVTAVKPAGSTSCILGTASGIHPHHAKRYIRRVQANRNEFPAKFYREKNPLAVETSVWSASGTDEVVSFLCEVPRGAILKNSISAVEFLDFVKKTQENWIEHGTSPQYCTRPYTRHNVSVTAIVKPDEWDAVEKFIYNNQALFAGISLLPSSGDLDYQQAPFSTVLTPEEIVEEYGDASVFASGLIVDGLAAFDNNLWRGCDTVLGFGEQLEEEMSVPEMPAKNGYTFKEFNKKLIEFYQYKEVYENWFAKKDWARRVNQFAERYFGGDVRRATYCLKHVSLWKTWVDIQREHQDVDWSTVVEEDQSFVDANTLGAQACANGACSLV